MVTIHRERGFRFVIHTDDHSPAHVHVIHAEGVAKIQLAEGSGRPRLISASRGMKPSTLRRAFALAAEHQGEFMIAWRHIHG